MVHFMRAGCFYVPKKLRVVLLVCLVVIIGLALLLPIHALALIIGTGGREMRWRQQAIKWSIPVHTHGLIRNLSQRIEMQLNQTKWRYMVHQSTKDAYNQLILVKNRIQTLKVTGLQGGGPRLYQSLQSCSPAVNVRTVFFMRLPKCASTSFVELMKKTTKSNGRFLFHFNPSGAYDWNKRTIDEVCRLIKNQLKTNHRVLYARHFYYTDFPSVSLNHTYITIVRDTVSRVVSSYLYYHFSSRPHIQSMLDPTHRNESLEKCLELNHEGCTPNLMTKYFCGHQKMCKTGSRRALNQAIFNIQKHFTVIGLMEDLHNTYKLFKTLLPEYFGGLDTREMSVVQKNRNEQSMVVSSDIQRKIEEINKADVMLYDYIQKKFNEQISNCINEKKIHNMSYKTANTTITTDN